MNLLLLFKILIPLLTAFFGVSCLSIFVFLLITRDPAKGKFLRLGLKSLGLAIVLALIFLLF